MIRTDLLALVFLWVGAALVFSRLRWFRTQTLSSRLARYSASGRERVTAGDSAVTNSSAGAWGAIVPFVTDVGDQLSRLFGVSDELQNRLERSGRDGDVGAFRLRQAAWAFIVAVGTAGMCLATSVPVPAALLAVIAAPVLSFLIMEQTVISQSQDWQRRMESELPVVIEQLGMLLSSGYSLGAAVNRMSERGGGVSSRELGKVATRIRQGVSEVDALREWADASELPSVQRVVSVLALNWEASDLGALISSEARVVRRDVQRKQLELLEKRSEQVWIPVTVATLLPGVIFMAVPFVQAMSRLTGG